jgi:soluble lytic murein transglycosylase
MKYILLLSVFVITATRCSSLSTKQALELNPLNTYTFFDQDRKPQEVETYLKTIESENKDSEITTWWANYLRARAWKKQNPKYSCQLYTQLSKDRAFPLQKLAFLRSQEVCPINEETSTLYDLAYFKNEVWLHDLHIDLAYTKASQTNNHKELTTLALLKSKESLIPSQKIAYMQEAIQAASKLGDEKLVKTYQNRLYRLAPRLHPNPPESERLDVAFDLRKARQFDKAIANYQKVINGKKNTYHQKVKAYRGIRATYKLMHDKKKYVTATNQLASFIESYYNKNKKTAFYQKEFLNIQIELARTLWTEGMISETKTQLEKTIQMLSGKQSLEEVYWVLARMEEEKGNFDGALTLADAALAERSQSKDILEKVLWLKAWNLRKLGFYQDSITYFDRLVENATSPFIKNKFMYWQAISLKDMNEEARANGILENLIEIDPFGYYGVLAYEALGKDIPTLLANTEYEIKKERLTAKKDTDSYLLWLIAVRELDASHKLLASLPLEKMSFKDQVKTLKFYKLAEDYRGLFVRISVMDPTLRNKLVAVDPEFFYPRPYLDLITQNAEKYGVSPELILSIMRQESAFDPVARSHADAFGLMQVLPREAKRMALLHKIPMSDEEDLFKPEVNIPVGSAYMKELWDRYNGQFIVSVASYNASAQAVKGWIKTRYRGDAYQFVEDVPYEETKEYIKLIFRNMVMYKRMNYSMQKIAFPAWCFNTLDSYATENQLVSNEQVPFTAQPSKFAPVIEQ